MAERFDIGDEDDEDGWDQDQSTDYESSWTEVSPAAVMAATPAHSPFSTSQQITTKVPPAYDGRTDWFRYEEAVEEWLDLTELNKDKQGPALRARLDGAATMYREVLDRGKLKLSSGVSYFLNTLRPYFVKGKHAVFLWRFPER